MIPRILPILGAAALAVLAGPAIAGPCAAQIDAAQAAVDARLAAVAAAGPSATESRAALLNRQPTPSSIAQAEEKLGEGEQAANALAALQLARKADSAGDKVACENAVLEARRMLQ